MKETNIFTSVLPEYLFKKSNIIKIVLFTAVYALIFINIYKPFGSGTWDSSLTGIYFFLYSSVIVLIGFVVIALSRTVMYFWNLRQRIVNIQYVVWILFEMFFMAIFFTIIVLAVNNNANAWDTFKECFNGTILILLLPYIILHIFISLSERNRELEERDGIKPVDSAARMIDFYDERMSTMVAYRYLDGSATFGKRRRDAIDTLSAEIILQGYIDRERAARG